jgi:hypothetical protein
MVILTSIKYVQFHINSVFVFLNLKINIIFHVFHITKLSLINASYLIFCTVFHILQYFASIYSNVWTALVHY